MLVWGAVSLQEAKYFEDAFQVYERGIAVFKYPHVRDIWTTYLTKFVARYGGKKLERARDLFEQAVEKVGAVACKTLAKFRECRSESASGFRSRCERALSDHGVRHVVTTVSPWSAIEAKRVPLPDVAWRY